MVRSQVVWHSVRVKFRYNFAETGFDLELNLQKDFEGGISSAPNGVFIAPLKVVGDGILGHQKSG